MAAITQGTIISGVRSSKYVGTICNAIIISARCDLANCKVSQIYYVTAMSCDDWIMSDEGFSTVLAGRVKEIGEKINAQLKKSGLDWETLKNFTRAEFETVIWDKEVGLGKMAEQCMDLYDSYQKYQAKGLSTEEKKKILGKEKKSVIKYISSISNGQVMHYIFLPKKAYCENSGLDEGMIVDLQELDRFDLEVANVIASCNMDCKSREITDEEKTRYDKQFWLMDEPGYALIECSIESPWLEYLMQHFASSFTRIGVDGPQKKEIDQIIDRVCKEEKNEVLTF